MPRWQAGMEGDMTQRTMMFRRITPKTIVATITSRFARFRLSSKSTQELAIITESHNETTSAAMDVHQK